MAHEVAQEAHGGVHAKNAAASQMKHHKPGLTPKGHSAGHHTMPGGHADKNAPMAC